MTAGFILIACFVVVVVAAGYLVAWTLDEPRAGQSRRWNGPR